MGLQDDSTARPATTARGARTRRLILDVAGELFSQTAVSQVRIEDIAEGAGVSVGTLYKHFTNKQGILLAFTTEAIDEFEARLEEARANASPLMRVYAVGDAYSAFAREHPVSYRFMVLRAMQPDDSPELKEIQADLSRRTQLLVLQVATDLKEAMDAGETPRVPIDEMITFLWAFWYGMTSLMIRRDGSAIPQELADRSIERGRDLIRRAAAHFEAHPEPLPPL